MCSVNQGMSGFGGRSCRDNEKVNLKFWREELHERNL